MSELTEEGVKELPEDFEGKGGQRGNIFNQINKTSKAYLYEIRCKKTRRVHWEVFKRRIRKAENRVLYPKPESFGYWAWCISCRKRAEQKFAEISG